MNDDREGDDLVRTLAELAKKKESEPPPELTNDVVINLAGLTPLQYAQQLLREAKKYKTPVKLLEKAVEAVKVEHEAEKLLEPHWEVTPADDPGHDQPSNTRGWAVPVALIGGRRPSLVALPAVRCPCGC